MKQKLYYNIPDLLSRYMNFSYSDGNTFRKIEYEQSSQSDISENSREKKRKGRLKSTGINISRILEVVEIGGAFTKSEIVERIIDKYSHLNEKQVSFDVEKGILYLEQEGYISYLPDRNGETTVCIYWYFNNDIREF